MLATPSFPGFSRVEPLAAGGTGSVWRAWQDGLEREVAIKTLREDRRGDPRLHDAIEREARLLAELDHPGIVPVHLVGETPEGLYCVMRLVRGESIDRHLAQADPPRIAGTFRAVAEALATAHRKGLLHRDLKPANILVEADGRPVLVDFGLAVRAASEEARAEHGLVGTLDYLAPELLAGGDYSEASDVYALGASLYTVLAGRAPFAGLELDRKLEAIREEGPPLPRSLRPEVPRELQAIALQALERRPEDRYPDAAAMARDLERYERGDVVQALPLRSRGMLARKLERQLSEQAEWAAQGLIDEEALRELQQAFQRVAERRRGLLRGVLGSLSSVLLLAGILLCVLGPTLLLQITWEDQPALLRLLLPATPFALLYVLGLRRRRARDPRRAVACLLGAALLAVPLAFVLADLLPPLRAVIDAGGAPHPVLPGLMWLPGDEAPDWARAGAPLLEWKLLLTALGALAFATLLHARTRAAAFLWVACVAGLGALVCAALRGGWRELPDVARWLLSLTLALGLLATGALQDRHSRHEAAWPFYGLGFLALLITSANFSGHGLPAVLLGCERGRSAESWSSILHGLCLSVGGVLAHYRGTRLQSLSAGLPLLAGFALSLGGFASLTTGDGSGYELLLVLACTAQLVLGLGLQRNTLVLPAAIALPFTVGAVTQRHVDAVWAWSLAIVLGGALLVLLGLRTRTESHT